MDTTTPEAPAPPVDEIEAIHTDGTKTTITYTTNGPKGPERIIRESAIPVHPDFTAALRALGPHLLDLCEIPTRAGSTVEVRGIGFKRNKEGAEGGIIKGVRPYTESIGVHVLNSPLHFSEDALPKRRFSPETWKACVKLREEALLFIGGKAAQGDLFASGDGQATGDPEPPAGEMPEEPKKTAGRKKAAPAADRV